MRHLLFARKSHRAWFSSRQIASYVQGQTVENKIREYFYFIDHQGMLFLDDARMKNFTSCFKDVVFLDFFFKRLRKNDTDRYNVDFPYISLCGRERNYIRCDDSPIVFTNVINVMGEECLAHNHAKDKLWLPFHPDKIYMHPDNGRIYHPAPDKFGSVGLMHYKMAIEFSKLFEFKSSESSQFPTHIRWNGSTLVLDSSWFPKNEKRWNQGV